jgi:hypothetical protein
MTSLSNANETETAQDERVDAFCRALKTALSKRASSSRAAPTTLLPHSQHCLQTLARKQVALRTALNVLEKRVWPTLVQGIRRGKDSPGSNQRTASNSNANELVISKDDLPAVLQHVFTQVLRLHDGLILLISGECRHVGDCQARKPFATRLTQNATRADGYTALYKSNLLYSGASMDEWFDERNGLQAAWQQVLGNARWERLLEKHPLMESLLSELETNLQSVQQSFTSLADRIVHDLQRALQVRVKLSLPDQLEKLSVDKRTWERRGKTFQWNDPAGVLPMGWTVAQWRASLDWTPPTTRSSKVASKSTKRRRVIQDDEDDDDDDTEGAGKTSKVPSKRRAKENQPRQPLAEGLRLKTTKAQSSETSIPVDSLNQIKETMGVNVQALQQARDGLEAEEAGARQDAAVADDTHIDEFYWDDDQRAAAVRKVEILKRQLRRILKSTADIYDVWDARECLRQALMEAGNLHLWSESKTDRPSRLQQADHFFTQAAQVVQDQKDWYERLAKAMRPGEAQACWRNLFLLFAQASVNRGIVRVEMLHHKNLQQAITHLEAADQECEHLRDQTRKDQEGGASRFETTLDLLRAQETMVLSLRWKAEALWKLGKKTEAVTAFSTAGNWKDGSLKSTEDDDILQASLTVKTESYYAWTRLIDLLSQDFHRSPMYLQSQEKWEWAKTTLTTAFQGAIVCSRGLHQGLKLHTKLKERLLTFLQEYDVMDIDELANAQIQLFGELETRRQNSAKSLAKEKPAFDLARSDVAHTGDGSNVPTTERWLLTGNEDSHKRRQRKRYGAGYSNIRVPSATEERTKVSVKQQFRPWGDDLFPKKRDKSGNWVPDLPHPFCAPEMPPEIRAILEQQGSL